MTRLTWLLLVFLVVVVAGVGVLAGYQMGGLAAATPRALVASPARTANPYGHAHLPDPTLTPGDVAAAAHAGGGGPDDVCLAGYSAAHRGTVTAAMRQRIFAAYGLVYAPGTVDYELDHLIPVELGGRTTDANLWPEIAQPPGYPMKDRLENRLRTLVCAGTYTGGLVAAQRDIAADWLATFYRVGA